MIDILFLLVAGLLVAAGTAKLARPRPTAQALYAASLPGSEVLARAIGFVEVLVGVAAIVRPTPTVALFVAALYLGFGGFVVFLMVAHPEAASCGCAGARDTPPSVLHALLNLVAAAVAVSAAVVGTASLAEIVDELGPTTLIVASGLTAAGWLIAVIVAELPSAIATWTPPRHHEIAGGIDPDRHRRADIALTTSGIGPEHPSLWPDHDPATGLPLKDADVVR